MARKEAIFKVGIDDGNTVNDLKNLNKSFEELNQSATNTKKTLSDTSGMDKFQKELKDLDALIDSGTLDMRQMTKVIQDYQTIAFKAGERSPVGAKAIQKASALKDRITDLNNRVKQGASDYAKMDAAIQGASGAMAGFTAFQGVTALMGNENEELLQTMVKLQAGMSVLNSLQVIRNTLNKDSALSQQFQSLQMKIATKETYAQATAQKLSNGLFGEGTKLAKGFSKALVFTGIGALVVGIGLLIANWDKLKKSIFGVNEAQKLNNDTMMTAVDSIAEELSASDKLAKTLNDEKKTREEKVQAVKDLQAQYPNLLSNVDAEKDSIEDVNKALELNVKLMRLKAQQDAINELRVEEFKTQTQELVKAKTGENKTWLESLQGYGLNIDAQELANAKSLESVKASKEQVNALDDLDASLQKQIEALKESGAVDGEESNKKVNNAKNVADARQKANDEYNKMLLDQANLEEEIRRMRLSKSELEEIAIADKYDKLFERASGNAELEKQLIEQQTIELNALYQKRKDEQTAIDDAEFQKRIEREDAQFNMLQELNNTKEEQEIADLVASYETKFALAEGNIELETALQTDLNTRLKEINEKYRQEERDADEKLKDEKIKNFMEYTSTVNDGLNVMNDLNTLVADIQINRAEGDQKKQEQIARRAFKIGKALQLSMATVQGVQAVQNAFTTAEASPITLVNPAYPFIQAGIAGATSAINIAKIASTTFKGGGGGGGGSIPRASSGASASSFSIGDNTSSAQTELNPDGSVQNAPAVSKVIVVESDITEKQNSAQQIAVKSTF